LVESVEEIAKDPFSVFQLLADNLPMATHFYMNYLVLQCAAHGIALLRHMQLVKFILFRALYSEEEARALAEPEDQASQGMGARYAQLMIVMTICIIFSTLSPLVAPLSLVCFGVCRLVYGYLLVYAETRKSDLGGAFWVTQLKHMQAAVVLYCILMIGMLNRAPTRYPMYIAAPSLLFVAWSYVHFSNMEWVKLPFEEINRVEGQFAMVETDEVYIQPQLLEHHDHDKAISCNSVSVHISADGEDHQTETAREVEM